jgi:hypothetical protein
LTPRPIDLARVRAALAKLDKLEAEHPEAFGGRNAAGWIEVIKTDEGARIMAEETMQTAVRIPVTLVAQVDAFAEAWKATNPGVQLTRSDAIRLLIVRGLEASKP